MTYLQHYMSVPGTVRPYHCYNYFLIILVVTTYSCGVRFVLHLVFEPICVFMFRSLSVTKSINHGQQFILAKKKNMLFFLKRSKFQA